MSGLRLMWRNTRMIVLCAITAALYAAVLIPFKPVPLIPGVVEFRPANAIPIVCSFLFGPAAAWGSAIGNMIGDFFGGVSPGDAFGFIGNLVYALIPFKVWEVVAAGQSPILVSPMVVLKYFFVCLLASVLCADLIGFGDAVLVIRPFSLLGNVVIINNMVAGLALSPFILRAVYPRVRKGRMLYGDLMPELRPRPRPVRLAGIALLIVGEMGAWTAGNLISIGYWTPSFLPAWMNVTPYDKPILIIVGPLILLGIAGAVVI